MEDGHDYTKFKLNPVMILRPLTLSVSVRAAAAGHKQG